MFVLVEENENYDDVVGNTQDLPRFNFSIHGYRLATNYFADTHPWVNNYFILTAGHPAFSDLWTSEGLLADVHGGLVTGEKITSILTYYKNTWKAYLEDFPRLARSLPVTLNM